MLSDERIRELARGTYRADSVDDACEEAIRTAVEETAEACKAELAAANEARERLMEAFETVTGTRETLHAANVAGAIQDIADERDALRAEVERLREDAERYQWLRDQLHNQPLTYIYALPVQWGVDYRGEEGDCMDAAIDAARKE